jgi:hypothetical protein
VVLNMFTTEVPMPTPHLGALATGPVCVEGTTKSARPEYLSEIKPFQGWLTAATTGAAFVNDVRPLRPPNHRTG